MEQYLYSRKHQSASQNEYERHDDRHEGNAQAAASLMQDLPHIAAVPGVSRRVLQDSCIVWNYFAEAGQIPQTSIATEESSNCTPRQLARFTLTGKEGGDGECDDGGRHSTHMLQKKRKRDEKETEESGSEGMVDGGAVCYPLW
eukprot:6196950-Pleurochrysis_carterae.AAC.1